jgi:hypothetical protein
VLPISSLKSHVQVMGPAPVDWSVNCTDNGDWPEVVLAVNCALGAPVEITAGVGAGVDVGFYFPVLVTPYPGRTIKKGNYFTSTFRTR